MPPLACPQSSLILCRIGDYYSISAKGMMGSEEEKEEVPHFPSSHFPPRQSSMRYRPWNPRTNMNNVEYLTHRASTAFPSCKTHNNNNLHLYSANLYMNIFGCALQYCYIKFMLKVTKAWATIKNYNKKY